MSKWLMCLTATALASGVAFAQDTTQEEATDAVEQATDQWEQPPATTDDPTQSDDTMSDDHMMGEQQMGEEQQPPTESQTPESGMEMKQSVADMSAEELKGLTIVSATGEEIGEIDRVGHTDQQADRVAAVNVGGFLGVGEKTIAIPLSELEMTADGKLQTALSRESLQSEEELDEQSFTDETPETETPDTDY